MDKELSLPDDCIFLPWEANIALAGQLLRSGTAEKMKVMGQDKSFLDDHMTVIGLW